MHCIVFFLTFLLGLVYHANCKTVFDNGVSDDDKNLIVSLHNKIRGLISQGKVPGQPKGKHLKTIKYDENLAQLAQALSDSCVFAHDHPHDDRWPAVGQNLYKWSSTGYQEGINWNKAVESWFEEYKDYKYGGPINDKNGHYTQLVWGDTEYIGCGYTFCEASGPYKYEKIYACNYGPAGNYEGEKPYDI